MTTELEKSNYQAFLESIWFGELPPERRKMLLLGTLALAVTLNDQLLLESWLPRASGILEQVEMEELVLQNLLFAGFPKTIEALKILRRHYPEVLKSVSTQDRRQQGLSTSQKIYGKRQNRLLQIMDELHPDITDWMIEDGYGRVLSRPGLELMDRELAVIAALMATGMHQQFRAHFRGALNIGVGQDDILWYTNCFQCILTSGQQQQFEQTRDQVLAEMITPRQRRS